MLKAIQQYLMWLSGVLLWVIAANGWSANFYQARVPIESQSQSERNKAASIGLREVLVRVSGTLDIDQSPELLNALGSAASYVDQYQYDVERDQWGDRQEYISLTFAPSVIEKLLLNAAMPFWPTNRPETLLWMVKDDVEDGKHLVSDPQDPLLAALLQAAEQRGVPLRLPLLDLDDQLAMPAENLWALDEEAILMASERYRADTVFVGRYTQTSTGQYWATWQFFHRGDTRIVDYRVEDPVQMGNLAISPLADYLASLYAIVPNVESAPQIVMRIDGIQGFASYRGVIDYLQGLAAVTSFRLVLLADQHLLLSLQLNGDLQQLNNTLSLDRKMHSEESQVSPDAPWIALPRGTRDHPLRYRWIGG